MKFYEMRRFLMKNEGLILDRKINGFSGAMKSCGFKHNGNRYEKYIVLNNTQYIVELELDDVMDRLVMSLRHDMSFGRRVCTSRRIDSIKNMDDIGDMFAEILDQIDDI